jgi:hypothetical protein
MGRARIIIDDVHKNDFCLFSPVPEYNVSQSFTGLGPGKHKLSIRVLGQACGGSDSNVSLDALVTAQGTIQDTARDVIWNTWMGKSNPKARQGSFRFSKSAGETVKLRFNGPTVRVMALKGPRYGEMRVLIDGNVVATLNLFNPTLVQASFRYKKLGPGVHEIVLQNVGPQPKRGLPIDGFRGTNLISPTLEGE